MLIVHGDEVSHVTRILSVVCGQVIMICYDVFFIVVLHIDALSCQFTTL